MPWTVEKKGSTFCVFKQGADKHPTGAALKCYPTNAEAQQYMKALYANEPGASRGVLRDIWDRLLDFFANEPDEDAEVERTIKDVASWDGSASQWSSPAAFCEDCLLDANAAAGKSGADKTKALCYLPIRGPDDPNTTYVRQAAHACAGGRGISRLVKPAEVSAADWSTLVKAAAKKLISIYGQMKETPPDSMYVAAGEQVPKRERAVSMGQIEMKVAHQLGELGFWLNDIYDDNGALYAVIVAEGKIYRAPITITGTDIQTGDLAEVELTFKDVPNANPPEPDLGALAPAPEPAYAENWSDMYMSNSRFTVLRQADGSHRWFAVTESAVVNRVGEIDSRQLFDSFISHLQGYGYPVLRFFHTEGLDFGRADWAARDDNLLLASGTFDEASPIARAMIQDAEDQHSGVTWGTSNGYRPTVSPQLVEVADGVRLPVYTAGVWREISVLPESSAASLFTSFNAEVSMRQDVKDSLRALLKDDEALAKCEATADSLNREIKDGDLVTRDAETVAAPATEAAPAEAAPAVETKSAEEAKPAEPVVAEAQPDPLAESKPVEPKSELVLDPATLTEIAKLVAAQMQPPETDITGAMSKALKSYLDPVVVQLTALGDQVAGLQREVDGRAQVRKDDMPARQQTVVTHRPREERATNTGPQTLADVAEATLAQIPRPAVKPHLQAPSGPMGNIVFPKVDPKQ